MGIRRRFTGDRKGFGERVAKLRERRGLSQITLAHATGVSQTCIWNWEEGNTFPRPENIMRLATALGTTPMFLQGGDASNSYDGGGSNYDAQDGVMSLPKLIDEARKSISIAAGLPMDRVRIVLDYGS